MDAPDGRVVVRSYRLVLDEVERRIFRVDRWRLPTPHGVSVRSILYFLVFLAAVALLSALPAFGALIDALPPSLPWVALPVLGALALSVWRIDGRAPHRALASALRWRLRPRTLAGLRRCPEVGSELSPLSEVVVASTGDEPRYRRGRVRGPARVTLAYPCRIELQGVPGGTGGSKGERLRRARRVRVIPTPGGRPLSRARVLSVPRGKKVTFG